MASARGKHRRSFFLIERAETYILAHIDIGMRLDGLKDGAEESALFFLKNRPQNLKK